MALFIPDGIVVSEEDIGQSILKIYKDDVLLLDFEWRKSPDGRWSVYDRVKKKPMELSGMVQVETGGGNTALYSQAALEAKIQNGSAQYIDTGYNPVLDRRTK